MIIKGKDPVDGQIEQLEFLLKANITSAQKKLIETETKIIKSGIKGENSSAYFLDFHFGETKNWAILHDLRVEHNGQVAQIDHLLINRFLEFYVLESKNYANGMKITEDGDFLIFYAGRSKAVESPIEQNERHIFLLQKFLNSSQDILPKRLGIRLKPSFKNYVIISPHSKVTRPKKSLLDTSAVIKSDTLYSMIKKQIDENSLQTAVMISKIIGQDTLQEFAQNIVLHHKPAPAIDFRKKFGIEISEAEVKEEGGSYQASEDLDSNSDPETSACPRCGGELVERIAKKGANAGNSFLGCSTFPKCKYTRGSKVSA